MSGQVNRKTLHELGLATDKSYVHQYLHVYEGLFEPIRDKAQNVLELGIWEGNSHRMWRDYFPKATVYGIDITSDRCGLMEDEERIVVTFANGYTKESVRSFNDIQFDVVVDDGPHSLESQKFCAQNYSPLLAPNGILVIEDIPKMEWISEIAEVVPERLKPYMYAIDRRMAPDIHSINDDIMFVIDKRYA